jgi:hypothetical protein
MSDINKTTEERQNVVRERLANEQAQGIVTFLEERDSNIMLGNMPRRKIIIALVRQQ